MSRIRHFEVEEDMYPIICSECGEQIRIGDRALETVEGVYCAPCEDEILEGQYENYWERSRT